MKTPLLILLSLLFARLAFAAEFSKGDAVTLTRDEPLYFKDSVYRQGSKGETFTVHSHSAEKHKVFVVTKDDKGQPIGLNVNDDALAVGSVPAPPSSSPASPKQNERQQSQARRSLKPPPISMDVKETGTAKLKTVDWSTSYGSYDVAYYRDKDISVEVRNVGREPVKAVVTVYLVGKSLATDGRHILSRRALPFDLRPISTETQSMRSEGVDSSILNLSALGERWVSGSKLEGWMAVAIIDGQIVLSRASTPTLVRIAEGDELAKLVADFEKHEKE